MKLKEYLETKRNADGSYKPVGIYPSVCIDPRLVDEGEPFNYLCHHKANTELIYVGEGGLLACLNEGCFQEMREENPDWEDEWIETYDITCDEEYDEPYYSKQAIEEYDTWLRELYMSKDEKIAEIDKEIKNLEEQKQWLIDKE